MKAHYQQAATLLRRMDEYDRLYPAIEQIVTARGIPDRAALPLLDAALGISLTNSRYQKIAEVSSITATRDLRMLSELKLLDAVGETRARRYRRGKELTDLRNSVRISMPLQDPYAIETTSIINQNVRSSITY